MSQESSMEGILLKDYKLGATIGNGAFSRVLAGTHVITGESVGIKIVIKQSQGERVRKQLRILRRVRHPNIIQLYEILEDSHHIYIVTQLARCGQLFQHITAQSKLTEFQASKILQQLLDAVEYMHELGIAHRDLKPENILLDYKYNVKVADWGLSNLYAKDQMLKTACGSPFYAAPEMLQALPYDPLKADIWSVGIVLYAMCFGFLPFDEGDPKQIYSKIKEEGYQIPQHASNQLKQLLSIILQIKPEKRATIEQIRSHPFLKFSKTMHSTGIIIGLSTIPIEENIVEEIIKYTQSLQRIVEKSKMIQDLKNNRHNALTAMYYLILQRNLRRNNSTMLAYYAERDFTINRYLLVQKVKLNYYNRIKKQQKLQKLIFQKRQTNKNRHEVLSYFNNGLSDSRKKRAKSCGKSIVRKKLFTPQKKKKAKGLKKTINLKG